MPIPRQIRDNLFHTLCFEIYQSICPEFVILAFGDSVNTNPLKLCWFLCNLCVPCAEKVDFGSVDADNAEFICLFLSNFELCYDFKNMQYDLIDIHAN